MFGRQAIATPKQRGGIWFFSHPWVFVSLAIGLALVLYVSWVQLKNVTFSFSFQINLEFFFCIYTFDLFLHGWVLSAISGTAEKYHIFQITKIASFLHNAHFPTYPNCRLQIPILLCCSWMRGLLFSSRWLRIDHTLIARSYSDRWSMCDIFASLFSSSHSLHLSYENGSQSSK